MTLRTRRGECVAVSVHCLDDTTAVERATVPVTCLDGRNDDWTAPPDIDGWP